VTRLIRGIITALAAVGLVAAVNVASSSAAPTLAFEAQFGTAADFYDRFDYGLSGLLDGVYTQAPTHGDHNMACMGPTTLRDVVLGGSPIYNQLFWHCAPTGDPSSGHVMTGIDTTGYNIAWFSPKPTFTAVSKVCWDINMTELSHRKWTQVLFVGQADAVRYPDGQTINGPQWKARGTGGFDLGYVSPDFQFPALNGPTSGIEPQGGTLAGVKVQENAPSWFQNQTNWTFRGFGLALNGITDKAARYTQCVENQPNNIVRFTQNTPGAPRTFDMPGQIPQAPVRVVFQDDNYDPIKGDAYNRDNMTWHWDNIQIFTEGSAPPTTTTAATTTTVATTTTQPTTTTTAATTTTTAATTTTQPSTTTTHATTTTATSLPTTTTTTAATSTTAATTTIPAPACPATFSQVEVAWCELVNARLDALEAA